MADTVPPAAPTASSSGSPYPNPSSSPLPIAFARDQIAIPQDGQVKLQWATGSEVSHYSIYRSTVRSGPMTLLKTGVGEGTYTDSGLVNDRDYYYSVVKEGSGAPTQSAAHAIPSDYPLNQFAAVKDFRGIPVRTPSKTFVLGNSFPGNLNQGMLPPPIPSGPWMNYYPGPVQAFVPMSFGKFTLDPLSGVSAVYGEWTEGSQTTFQAYSIDGKAFGTLAGLGSSPLAGIVAYSLQDAHKGMHQYFFMSHDTGTWDCSKGETLWTDRNSFQCPQGYTGKIFEVLQRVAIEGSTPPTTVSPGLYDLLTPLAPVDQALNQLVEISSPKSRPNAFALMTAKKDARGNPVREQFGHFAYWNGRLYVEHHFVSESTDAQGQVKVIRLFGDPQFPSTLRVFGVDLSKVVQPLGEIPLPFWVDRFAVALKGGIPTLFGIDAQDAAVLKTTSLDPALGYGPRPLGPSTHFPALSQKSRVMNTLVDVSASSDGSKLVVTTGTDQNVLIVDPASLVAISSVGAAGGLLRTQDPSLRPSLLGVLPKVGSASNGSNGGFDWPVGAGIDAQGNLVVGFSQPTWFHMNGIEKYSPSGAGFSATPAWRFTSSLGAAVPAIAPDNPNKLYGPTVEIQMDWNASQNLNQAGSFTVQPLTTGQPTAVTMDCGRFPFDPRCSKATGNGFSTSIRNVTDIWDTNGLVNRRLLLTSIGSWAVLYRFDPNAFGEVAIPTAYFRDWSSYGWDPSVNLCLPADTCLNSLSWFDGQGDGGGAGATISSGEVQTHSADRASYLGTPQVLGDDGSLWADRHVDRETINQQKLVYWKFKGFDSRGVPSWYSPQALPMPSEFDGLNENWGRRKLIASGTTVCMDGYFKEDRNWAFFSDPALGTYACASGRCPSVTSVGGVLADADLNTVLPTNSDGRLYGLMTIGLPCASGNCSSTLSSTDQDFYETEDQWAGFARIGHVHAPYLHYSMACFDYKGVIEGSMSAPTLLWVIKQGLYGPTPPAIHMNEYEPAGFELVTPVGSDGHSLPVTQAQYAVVLQNVNNQFVLYKRQAAAGLDPTQVFKPIGRYKFTVTIGNVPPENPQTRELTGAYADLAGWAVKAFQRSSGEIIVLTNDYMTGWLFIKTRGMSSLR